MHIDSPYRKRYKGNKKTHDEERAHSLQRLMAVTNLRRKTNWNLEVINFLQNIGV